MELNLEEIERQEESPFIERFEEFFNLEYKKEIEKIIESYPEEKSLVVNYKILERFDPILADELVDNPEAVIAAASKAIQEVNIPSLNVEEFKPHIRFSNLPKDHEPNIRNISSKHLGKLIGVEGLVRQITDVLPKLTLAVWKCKRCGNTYRVPQEKQKLTPPGMCECHSRDFDLVEDQSGFIDYQKIQIQEPLEKLNGNEQAVYVDIYVSDDLVNKVSAGDKTKFVGILRLVPPQKDKKTVYGRFLECNYLEETQKEFTELDITKEEEEEIQKLSKDPKIYERLTGSVAPAIYGHDIVKESIVLQLFGGVTKHLPNNQSIRGNVHILLIGDPGCGKSQLLQATNNIAPKSIYFSGKTSSAAGLCVAPDTLVLNHSGFKPIQEFVEENFVGEGREEISGCFSNEFNKKTFTLGDNLKISKGKISKIWRIKAPKKMIEIKSRLGKELSLTPNTSLIRIQKGEFGWVKANEIKKGDYVACVRKLPFTESKKYSIEVLLKNKNIKIANNISKEFKQISDKLVNQKKYPTLMALAKKIGKSRATIYAWRNPKFYHGIALKDFIKLGKEAGWSIRKLSKCINLVFIAHGKTVKIPQMLNDPKIAYLAGLLIGDGSIYEQKKRTSLRLYNTSQEILDNFDNYLKEIFGIKTEKYIQKGVFVRRFASQIIYPLLKEYGLTNNKKENKISHFASESNKEILSALLRGIFDTDGYVSTTGSNHIGISTISKPLAQSIQLSLLKFGIISTLRERKLKGKISYGKNIIIQSKNNQFVIEIRSNNKHKFKKIGFNEKKKQKALQKITQKTSIKTNIDKIPLEKIIARKKIEELARHSDDPKLITLANSDIIWEEITEKKEFKPSYKHVYDFTVDETHNFIANGFITHNTATAVKDEFGEGGWTLKAGALVLASGGICMADELDKMDPQDRSALHEAMEQGMISVAKAGIVSRFKTDTSLLAAANPKYSRFDKFQPLLEQIELPASLISRFDLFFMIRDVLDRTIDQKISEHILKTHQSGEKLRHAKKSGIALSPEDKAYIDKITEPQIKDDLLRKYIAYARQNCFPVLTAESMEALTNFYVGLRDQGRNQGAFAATARQLEGLVRLSEASARVKLKDLVEIIDAEKAMMLVKKSLEDTVTDPETGKIDIDIVTSGTTHTQQNAISTTLRLVKDAMAEGIDMVPIEQIVAEAMEKGISEDKVMTAIADLEKKGDIYKPRHHYVKPTGKH